MRRKVNNYNEQVKWTCPWSITHVEKNSSVQNKNKSKYLVYREVNMEIKIEVDIKSRIQKETYIITI